MTVTFKLVGDKELQLYLGKVVSGMRPHAVSGLRKIGKHLQDKVKDKFGEYQPSWPKLKRASVIAKYKRRSLKGAGRKRNISFSIGPDQPLILFGDLRSSIKRELKTGSLEVEVYSDNPYSAVHEYGYAPKNVPARSYMRTTLDEESNEIVNIMSKEIGKLI